MKANVLFGLGLLLASWAAGPAAAAIPQTIGYEAVLTDSTGTPLDGTFDLTIRLYDAPTLGNLVLTETHAGVDVSGGVVSIEIGSQTGGGLSGLAFDRPYYLTIEVGTQGELAPRIPILSTPYSLNAGRIDGEPVDMSAGASAGDVLTYDGANQKWIPAAGGGGGDITSVTAGLGLAGGGATGDVTLDVNVGPGLQIAADAVQIPANGVTAGMIQPNVVSSLDGVTNDAGNIDLVAGSNVTITPDDAANTITISASGGAAGDITSVTAGAGLTGGGTSGAVTLNVGAGSGISVSSTAVGIATNGVTATHIAANAVGSSEIAADAVGSSEIAANAVGSSELANLVEGDEFRVSETSGFRGRLREFGSHGYLDLWSPTTANVLLSSLASDSSKGWAGVLDGNGSGFIQAYMYVDGAGNGVIVADTKNFVTANPNKAGTDIWYCSLEGPEAAAYVRGTARLQGGRARVALPDHFTAVASDKGLTVQVTPLSARSEGLAVTEKTPEHFLVEELHGGTGSYEFDYFVTAVRKGYENYRVIRKAAESAPARRPPPGP